jgi:hypothetical protein
MTEDKELLVDIKGLRRLYNKDVCARALLDHIADRKYNSAETTVDRLESVLSQDGDCSRREFVSALKELEKLKCGIFVIGRRGQASRFQWAVQMIEVGRAAKGEETPVPLLKMEDAKPEEAAESGLSAGTIRHAFNLRQNYTVTLDLPSDFNAKEAARLAEFVKTLPFDES